MDFTEPVKKLFETGESKDRFRFLNYTELGINESHIQQLIHVATNEKYFYDDDSDSPQKYAAIHAWHALGQLHAEEAIEPLISLFERLNDTWIDEEMPEVFAELGEKALPALEKYLADPPKTLHARINAAACIEQIGHNDLDLRKKSIAILTKQLKNYRQNWAELNGFLIYYLTDLSATESIDVIREAYQQNCVDFSIAGDLGTVEYELGLSEKEPSVQLFAEEMGKESDNDFGMAIPESFQINPDDPCPCGSGKEFKNCCLNKS